jgi:hypothetical protein
LLLNWKPTQTRMHKEYLLFLLMGYMRFLFTFKSWESGNLSFEISFKNSTFPTLKYTMTFAE